MIHTGEHSQRQKTVSEEKSLFYYNILSLIPGQVTHSKAHLDSVTDQNFG